GLLPEVLRDLVHGVAGGAADARRLALEAPAELARLLAFVEELLSLREAPVELDRRDEVGRAGRERVLLLRERLEQVGDAAEVVEAELVQDALLAVLRLLDVVVLELVGAHLVVHEAGDRRGAGRVDHLGERLERLLALLQPLERAAATPDLFERGDLGA